MKHKLFSIALISILSHWTSAEENSVQWDLEENPERYTLWAEMAFKHTIVEAIKAFETANSAVGLHYLDVNQKKIAAIPLAAGALAAVALSSNIAYRALDSQKPLPQKAHTYVSQYARSVSALNTAAQHKRMQYMRQRRALAYSSGFQIQEAAASLKSHIQPPSKAVVPRWSKALRGAGVFAIGAVSTGAYAGIVGSTAVIAFENEEEMQVVLEQFSNDVYEISETLEVSEGIELAGLFEIEGA